MGFRKYIDDGSYKFDVIIKEMDDDVVSDSSSEESKVNMYRSLNDAASVDPALSEGENMSIWYMSPSSFRDFGMGYDWVAEKNMLPENPGELSNTHVKLGSISSLDKDLEGIFSLMQGENWSPHGEARDLIRSLGLKHTSMSVGDIIMEGTDMYMIDSFGFKKINSDDNAQTVGEDDEDGIVNIAASDLPGGSDEPPVGTPVTVLSPAEKDPDAPATTLEGKTKEVTDELYDIIDTLDKARKSLREVKKRVEDDLQGHINRKPALEEYKTFYEVFSSIQDKNLHRMIELLKSV